MRSFPWWRKASKRTRTEVVFEWLLAQHKAKQEDKFLHRATNLVFTALMRVLPSLLEEELRRLGIIKQSESGQSEGGRRRKLGWEDLFEREIARFYQAAQQEMARQRVPNKYIRAGIASSFHQVPEVNETTRQEMRKLMADILKQPKPDQFRLAREITKRWSDISSRRAEMIAVTEWRRMSSVAHHLEAKDSGAKYKMWLTVGDMRVCRECASYMARGQVPIDDYWFDSPHPPAHPRCRCTVNYYTKLRPELQPPTVTITPGRPPTPQPSPAKPPTRPPISPPEQLPFPVDNLPDDNKDWAARAYAYSHGAKGDYNQAWTQFFADTNVWPDDLRAFAQHLDNYITQKGGWQGLDPDAKMAIAYSLGWTDVELLARIADVSEDVADRALNRLLTEGLKFTTPTSGEVTIELPRLTSILDRKRTFALSWVHAWEKAQGRELYAIMDLDSWFRPIPTSWTKTPEVVDQLAAKRSVTLECPLKADTISTQWGDVVYLPLTDQSWVIGRAGFPPMYFGTPRIWTPVQIGPIATTRYEESVPAKIRKLVGKAKTAEDCERIGEQVLDWVVPRSMIRKFEEYNRKLQDPAFAKNPKARSRLVAKMWDLESKLHRTAQHRLYSIRQTLRSAVNDLFFPPTDPELIEFIQSIDEFTSERLPADWFKDYYTRPQGLLQLRWMSPRDAEFAYGQYNGMRIELSREAAQLGWSSTVFTHELLHEVDTRNEKISKLIQDFARDYLSDIEPRIDGRFGLLGWRYDAPDRLPNEYMGVWDPGTKRLYEFITTGLEDPVLVAVQWSWRYPRLARFLIGLWVGG